MSFEDALKFLNRLGVRQVNDVTADVSDPVRLAVRCKDGRMYGKKMKDLHIAGVRMLSDAVVRFRTRDGKVVVADLMVAVGDVTTNSNAQKKIRTMKDSNNDKISDIASFEFDDNLTETVYLITEYGHCHIPSNVSFHVYFNSK